VQAACVGQSTQDSEDTTPVYPSRPAYIRQLTILTPWHVVSRTQYR
jgi:hypothetical protein